MTKDEYKKLVDKHIPKVNHIKSMSYAFFVGGFIGMLGQLLIDLYMIIFNITIKDAGTYMIVTLIMGA